MLFGICPRAAGGGGASWLHPSRRCRQALFPAAAYLAAQFPVLACRMLSQQRALRPAVGLKSRVHHLLFCLRRAAAGGARGRWVAAATCVQVGMAAACCCKDNRNEHRLFVALALACRWKSRARAPADSFSISRSGEASDPAAVAASAAAAALKKCEKSVRVLRWSCRWGCSGIEREVRTAVELSTTSRRAGVHESRTAVPRPGVWRHATCHLHAAEQH